MVTLYRSLSTMLDAGLPLFSIFELLAREGEDPGLTDACHRIAQRLVSGQSLHGAVSGEPNFFSPKSVKMMEAGFKGGTLAPVLRRLAEDEEDNWKLRQQIKSQLTYPVCIALAGVAAVILLPPLALADLLRTVVSMTEEPPALSLALLRLSELLGSPWLLLSLGLGTAGLVWLWRQDFLQAWLLKQEPLVWKIPAVGELWQDIIGLRFLSVFAMTYEAGLPATQCMVLASGATGSTAAQAAGPVMKKSLVDGGSLRESLASGQLLPRIVLEAVEAGEQVGKIPDMMRSAGRILQAEIESRIHAVTQFVEPLVLAFLGVCVGVFALGCLLPIIKLTEGL